MRKYLAILKVSWQNIFEHRSNLLLGQLRQVILFLTLYYLWKAVFSVQSNLFGFDFTQIITYIFIVQILRQVVLESRTDNIAEEITGDGKFFAYLLRPIGYLKYWLSVDLAYKAVNLILSLVELSLILLFLRVPIFAQPDSVRLILFLLSVILAAAVYFLISTGVGLITFWTEQTWGARFALSLLIEFTSGAFFPLTILPAPFQQVLNLTPFPYLVFFPVRIYLGQLNSEQILNGFIIQLGWALVSYIAVKLLWNKGLKVYVAYGG